MNNDNSNTGEIGKTQFQMMSNHPPGSNSFLGNQFRLPVTIAPSLPQSSSAVASSLPQSSSAQLMSVNHSIMSGGVVTTPQPRQRRGRPYKHLAPGCNRATSKAQSTTLLNVPQIIRTHSSPVTIKPLGFTSPESCHVPLCTTSPVAILPPTVSISAPHLSPQLQLTPQPAPAHQPKQAIQLSPIHPSQVRMQSALISNNILVTPNRTAINSLLPLSSPKTQLTLAHGNTGALLHASLIHTNPPQESPVPTVLINPRHAFSSGSGPGIQTGPRYVPGSAIDLSTKKDQSTVVQETDDMPCDLSINSPRKSAILESTTSIAEGSILKPITIDAVSASCDTKVKSGQPTSLSVGVCESPGQSASTMRSFGLTPVEHKNDAQGASLLRSSFLMSEHQKATTANANSQDILHDKTEDEEFIWEDFLEDTGSEAAPASAFVHVETSLKSGLTRGMKVEICNSDRPSNGSNLKDDTYWVATIIIATGQLLQLRYVGNEDDTSQDFWKDIKNVDLRPLGWCSNNHKQIQPHPSVKDKLKVWPEYLQKQIQNCKTPEQHLLDPNFGNTPIELIKRGTYVEVCEKYNPLLCWPAVIINNVGGRLQLRYAGVDNSDHDLWLFYLDQRIKAVVQHDPAEQHVYNPPYDMCPKNTRETWNRYLVKVLLQAKKQFVPPNVFNSSDSLVKHSFSVGMKLECLHPRLQNCIYPATIIKVFNDFYFLVNIDCYDSSEPALVCCHVKSPFIFPPHWSERQGLKITPPKGYKKADFDWIEYLHVNSAVPAPDSAFLYLMEKPFIQFVKGQKLEAVNPHDISQICAATITRIIGHLMWIHLDSFDDLSSNHVVDINSLSLFPVGWCETNGYHLIPPKNRRKKKIQSPIKLLDNNLTADEIRSATYSEIKSGGSSGGWCPKIYYNHTCFSGPYLSKGRIAELPKCLGPGPVSLVMIEVLKKLIKVGYKSSQVLKELEFDGKPNPHMILHVLKAKYQGKKFTAKVEICKSSHQVEEFCRQVCIKLECCPYLVSTHLVNGNCPENCSQLTKAKTTTTGKYKKKLKRHRLKNLPKVGKCKTYMAAPHKPKPMSIAEKKENTEKYIRQHTPSFIQTRGGTKLPKFTFERRTHKKIMLPSTRSERPFHSKTPSGFGGKKIGFASRPLINKKRNAKQARIMEYHRQKEKKRDIIEPLTGPPRRIVTDFPRLKTNPLLWTVDQLEEYLKTTDCYFLCDLLKEQDIDGQALMLMNLPTCQEFLDLKLGPALILCAQIEKIKVAFFELYA